MIEAARRTWFDSVNNFVRREPVTALLVATIVATFVFFFGFAPLFVRGMFISGATSVFGWGWQAWNPVANQEHSKLVPLIFLGLIWYHRKQIASAPKQADNRGLLFVLVGLGLFLLAARCLQPRLALGSLPFLIYGSVYYLWGKATARIILFPCAFLIFLIPFGAVEQATFRLQFVITTTIGFLCKLVGLHVDAIGTTLNASDDRFHFMIAEGCSGIRSLTAMVMLTSVYVHLAVSQWWKKVTVVAFSLLFALIGNVGRIFTVVLVARFGNPKFAEGLYHDYSDWLFFPIALAAMYLFARLLNTEPLNKRPVMAEAPPA